MSDVFEVLVTGSRHWTDLETVRRALDDVALWSAVEGKDVRLVHGGAKGLDQMAAKVAQNLGFEVVAVPAEWDKYGRAAGPRRNAAMVARRPHVVLGFPMPGSIGTWDCLRRAVDSGLNVHIYCSKGR